jgi:hypothetical protein
VAAIRVANGRRVKRSNFDLNTLVPGTIPKQLRLDTDFSAFHPEGTEYPLIVVRSSLVSGQSPSSLLESIYIYPAESEKIPRTSLFSSAQVTSGVVENLIAAFVQRDGGFPRLKGGGRSFSECLLKMEMPAKVN